RTHYYRRAARKPKLTRLDQRERIGWRKGFALKGRSIRAGAFFSAATVAIEKQYLLLFTLGGNVNFAYPFALGVICLGRWKEPVYQLELPQAANVERTSNISCQSFRRFSPDPIQP